jgi:competence protein ComEA
MNHLKKLFVLTMAVALVVAIAPGLLAVEVENISEGALKVNINKASVDELCELKYIGSKLAERIVQYRTEHGPFETAEDIMKVRGIGQKVWDANKDMITVD